MLVTSVVYFRLYFSIVLISMKLAEFVSATTWVLIIELKILVFEQKQKDCRLWTSCTEFLLKIIN